jgi:hypothetical protein
VCLVLNEALFEYRGTVRPSYILFIFLHQLYQRGGSANLQAWSSTKKKDSSKLFGLNYHFLTISPNTVKCLKASRWHRFFSEFLFASNQMLMYDLRGSHCDRFSVM